MAEFASFSFFTDAYMRDCWHLTDAEHGRYLLLLILIWQSPQCRIPNDPNWIATKMRRTTDEYERDIAPIISQFCKVTGKGHWITQKRLLKEFSFTKEKREKNIRAAKARWGNENSDANAYAPHKRRRTKRNAPSPSPSPSPSAAATPPPLVQNPTRDAMQIVEDTLRAIPGIDKHPVAVAPVIAPIWQLVQQGYDLDAVIVPRIKAVLMKLPPGKKISSWEYFARIIVDEQQAARPPPPAFETRTDAEWTKLLAWARAKKVWDPKSQGPFPHTAGCIVPAHLLQPDDGKGWIDFKDYRPGQAA